MRSIRFKKKHVLYAVLVLLILAIQNLIYFDIPLEELKREFADENSRFLEIDGMQVHYRDEGNGIPLVLIHGTASSLHTWDGWTQKLKKEYRVIRMDLPAFGLTGPSLTGDYSIKSYTRFLSKFVEKMQLDSFYLAGNSLGGNIAWNYTTDHPNKIKKLILIDASGLPTEKSQPSVFKMAKTPVLNSILLYVTPKFFIKKNIKEVYADDSKISDDLVTRYHKLALREGNRQAFIDRAKIDFTISEYKTVEKLKQIKTQALIIWGDQDQWIPVSNGKRMDSLLPNSKLVVLKNTGHVPMEERPTESLHLFKEFLDQ